MIAIVINETSGGGIWNVNRGSETIAIIENMYGIWRAKDFSGAVSLDVDEFEYIVAKLKELNQGV